jgi:flagellar biosynthesis/type III secretory pathway chaperone
VSLDPQACRERYARHLADETTLLTQLEVQLQREHELLATNDIEGLETASPVRQQTVARLLRVNEERSALCRSRNLAADAYGFAKLLAWCDPEGSLAEAQQKCADHAQRCRAQNERNGALVTARLNRIGGMLGMLGTADSGRTYEPRGGARTPTLPTAGRMISTSA